MFAWNNRCSEDPLGPATARAGGRHMLSQSSSTTSLSDVIVRDNGGGTDGDWEDMRPEDISITNPRGGILFADDIKNEVYLSVHWAAGKLGVAYYDCGTCQIHVLADTVDTAPEFEILHKVVQVTNPVAVIASVKQDDRLLDALRQAVTMARGPEVDESGSVTMSTSDILQLVPNIDFEIGACRSRILNLYLPGMPQALTPSDQAIFISSLLDMNSQAMVRALGSLIKYLDRKRVNVELEDIGTRTPIASLSVFVFKDLVIIDNDTYAALQIFRKDRHPSAYKFASGMKEGFSLYGMLNQCKSSLGSQYMHKLFLRPTRNLDILEQRHLAIKYFLSQANTEVSQSLVNCLKNVKNVSIILAKMNAGKTTVLDWHALYKTTYNAILIADICKTAPRRIDIFRNISQDFTGDLLQIASNINKIIDFDESLAQSRSVVKLGVDERLDEKKRTYNGLPEFMTKVAQHELTRLSDDIQECKVVYLPQLGYLLSIPMSERMKANQCYAMEGLDFMFVSSNSVFYKSVSTKELDLLLGDIQNDIIDLEVQIILRLQNFVLERSRVLLTVVKHSAELDCLIALANAAKEFNFVQPEMNGRNLIQIEKGRHPLQELFVSTFVPNSTFSGGEHGKVKLITGPNASGKSVYLKQVGLIVFLAHIGSFIPAKSATIGVVDAIYSRIHTLESISVGLSTFMIDLNQMALATRCASSSSLVLIDEFGKGTSAVDGMALLAACINYWLIKSENSPHLLISTHIYGVSACLQPSKQLTFQTLEIAQDGKELAYLYRLIEGQSSCSFASHVARQAGIREDIIGRAFEVTECIRQSKPIPAKGDQEDEIYTRCSAVVEAFENLDFDSAEDLKAFLDSLNYEWASADRQAAERAKHLASGSGDATKSKPTLPEVLVTDSSG